MWISERITKRIPDSATGWKASVRKVTRVISQYSENIK